MAFVLSCSGDIVVANGAPICSGNWVLVQLPEVFDISQLDYAVLGQALAVGFAVGVSIFGIVAGCRILINCIKTF